MVWDLWCFEDLEEKDQLLDQSMNYKGDCRTASATPGLLNRLGRYGSKDTKYRRTSKLHRIWNQTMWIMGE